MSSPIRVVLQQEVDHLGASGDVVRVRRGYARNFLIPRGLAVPATPASMARVDELKRLAAVRATELLARAKEAATKLEAVSVKISRVVGDDNKMFGSVTTKDIEEAYKAKSIEVERRKLTLKEPIKTLGLHEVSVKLHADVTASLRVEVVKQS